MITALRQEKCKTQDIKSFIVKSDFKQKVNVISFRILFYLRAMFDLAQLIVGKRNRNKK